MKPEEIVTFDIELRDDGRFKTTEELLTFAKNDKRFKYNIWVTLGKPRSIVEFLSINPLDLIGKLNGFITEDNNNKAEVELINNHVELHSAFKDNNELFYACPRYYVTQNNDLRFIAFDICMRDD